MSALDTQVGGAHYREGGIQPVQYIEANNLGFLEGCVLKRVTRHNRANGKGRQDIEKAIHELQLLLELRYPKAQEPLEFDEERADIIGQNGNDGEHYSNDMLTDRIQLIFSKPSFQWWTRAMESGKEISIINHPGKWLVMSTEVNENFQGCAKLRLVVKRNA
jgi:hypothetical protein